MLRYKYIKREFDKLKKKEAFSVKKQLNTLEKVKRKKPNNRECSSTDSVENMESESSNIVDYADIFQTHVTGR